MTTSIKKALKRITPDLDNAVEFTTSESGMTLATNGYGVAFASYDRPGMQWGNAKDFRELSKFFKKLANKLDPQPAPAPAEAPKAAISLHLSAEEAGQLKALVGNTRGYELQRVYDALIEHADYESWPKFSCTDYAGDEVNAISIQRD